MNQKILLKNLQKMKRFSHCYVLKRLKESRIKIEDQLRRKPKHRKVKMGILRVVLKILKKIMKN